MKRNSKANASSHVPETLEGTIRVVEHLGGPSSINLTGALKAIHVVERATGETVPMLVVKLETPEDFGPFKNVPFRPLAIGVTDVTAALKAYEPTPEVAEDLAADQSAENPSASPREMNLADLLGSLEGDLTDPRN